MGLTISIFVSGNQPTLLKVRDDKHSGRVFCPQYFRWFTEAHLETIRQSFCQSHCKHSKGEDFKVA